MRREERRQVSQQRGFEDVACLIIGDRVAFWGREPRYPCRKEEEYILQVCLSCLCIHWSHKCLVTHHSTSGPVFALAFSEDSVEGLLEGEPGHAARPRNCDCSFCTDALAFRFLEYVGRPR